jgi:nucleotide-binding universal stress UspA family protein
MDGGGPKSLVDVRRAALAGHRAAFARHRQAPAAAPTFRSVLVSLDGSPAAETALPYAHALAAAFDARLTLLRVLEAPTNAGIASPVGPLEWEVMREQVRGYLQQVAARYPIRGDVPSVEVAEGRPAEQIVRQALVHDVDLIVLSSHGAGGHEGWAVSQTAHMVVSAAPTSVLLVPANGGPATVSFERLLVPLDGSLRSEVVLPAAMHLALRHRARLVLGYVVREPELPHVLPVAAEDRDLARRIVARSTEAARAYLEPLARRLRRRGLACEILVRQSRNCASGVCEMADATGPDLVLLAARGAGESAYPYGSVTEQVLQHGHHPLFVVRDRAAPTDEPGELPADIAAPGR